MPDGHAVRASVPGPIPYTGMPAKPGTAMHFQTKLPNVGTTIFTVMSQLAAEHGAVNLGQGFPDFPVPARLVDALGRAMQAGQNSGRLALCRYPDGMPASATNGG